MTVLIRKLDTPVPAAPVTTFQVPDSGRSTGQLRICGGLGTGNEAHLRRRWKDHSRTRGGMGVVTHRSSMADARDTRCCSTRSICKRVFERDAE